MELFRVENGPRIARVHRIHVPEKYYWFSATCNSDTLVAMTYPKYPDHSVRVHRLRGDRLEELARIQLKSPSRLLWLADRLLVADYDNEKQSHAVIELEVSDTRLERRRELFASSENIYVSSWCAVNDELVILDQNCTNSAQLVCFEIRDETKYIMNLLEDKSENELLLDKIILQPKLVCRILKQKLTNIENITNIYGMSYNSPHDKLCLTDKDNKVVRFRPRLFSSAIYHMQSNI